MVLSIRFLFVSLFQLTTGKLTKTAVGSKIAAKQQLVVNTALSEVKKNQSIILRHAFCTMRTTRTTLE